MATIQIECDAKTSSMAKTRIIDNNKNDKNKIAPVRDLEKRAPGVKSEKQRITFLFYSNATGSHKLKLLVIEKAKHPRCFKKFQCPADYKSSKSTWMTSAIFKQWFHESFVPQVTSFLKQKALPIKALLLIDNDPSHSNVAELTTENGQISAMFMPPNVTPLIQPMDQNAIKITKLHYRNSLLASIAATNCYRALKSCDSHSNNYQASTAVKYREISAAAAAAV
ncbi:jerky protein homolog-like [Anastrepha ludens]|uniref:jerky protein homolog-like n=1 Tax=Anastrepha ludens TaxID=28586 RepID=UPI0023B11235|nr:jerky protein homolog-like [Anastrepha ludens]